jgi:hypothetical protein
LQRHLNQVLALSLCRIISRSEQPLSILKALINCASRYCLNLPLVTVDLVDALSVGAAAAKAVSVGSSPLTPQSTPYHREEQLQSTIHFLFHLHVGNGVGRYVFKS